MTSSDSLLTPAELSEYLNGIPVGTIYQWRHRSVGPPGIRIGRHLRFRKSDVDAWLTDQQAARR